MTLKMDRGSAGGVPYPTEMQLPSLEDISEYSPLTASSTAFPQRFACVHVDTGKEARNTAREGRVLKPEYS